MLALNDGQIAKKADAGYASVEALMAALVLASALAFAQAAYIQARRAADLALELRLGRELAAVKMAEPLTALGETVGASSKYQWRVELTQTGHPGRVEICRRSVRIESLTSPSRHFELASLEPCPPKVAT